MAELTDFRVNYSLMDKPVLTVSIQLSDDDPVEVIIEKIKASLPKPMRSFKEGRKHPFDGPEVFDDGERSETPSPQGWDAPHGEVPHESLKDAVQRVSRESISDSYPRLKELFDAKRAEIRSQRPVEGEGEWLLNGDDDNIGKDCE